ncbi:MAG: hypothetical protein ABL997_06205, partial [Planctomycetota bacterium]
VRIPCGRPVDLLVLARSHRASFVDGVESARTVQLERAPRIAVRLGQPSDDLDRVSEVHFTPRLGRSSQARFVSASGFETALEQALEDSVTLDSEGRGTWAPRFATDYAVSGRIEAGGGGTHWCGGIHPRTVRAPNGDELVLHADR